MCKREELSNCPCCGAKNPKEYVHNNALVIECTKCCLSIQRSLVPSAEWEKAAVACRKAWNTRPSQDKLVELYIGEYSCFKIQHDDYLQFSCPKNYGERVRVTVEHIKG